MSLKVKIRIRKTYPVKWGNVVTFVWPSVHPKIELETRSKILSPRRGLWYFLKKPLWVTTLALEAKIHFIHQ